MFLFSCMALVAGAAIAVQAAMNARLGVLLNSSMVATSIAFFTSLFFTVVVMLVFTKQYPELVEIKSVPVFLWFSGVLSALGISLFYYLIPKMGVGNMMSYALTGQLLMAIVASHFGWFDLPIKQIGAIKSAGATLLIIGVILINWETEYGY